MSDTQLPLADRPVPRDSMDEELEALLRAARQAVCADVELRDAGSRGDGRIVLGLPFAVPADSLDDLALCFEAAMPGCAVCVLDATSVAIAGLDAASSRAR